MYVVEPRSFPSVPLSMSDTWMQNQELSWASLGVPRLLPSKTKKEKKKESVTLQS